MTHCRYKLFYLLPLILIVATGCPPEKSLIRQEAGSFLVASNKLYDESSDFDLRWTAMYPKQNKSFDPSLNVSNKELSQGRCTRCHECGFRKAFDLDHYGQPTWAPVYKGNQWEPIVDRMNRKDASLLNEQVAERIFTYLRDVTLGKYDEANDNKGAIVVNVDAPAPGATAGGGTAKAAEGGQAATPAPQPGTGAQQQPSGGG
jgi:hypothetical protein